MCAHASQLDPQHGSCTALTQRGLGGPYVPISASLFGIMTITTKCLSTVLICIPPITNMSDVFADLSDFLFLEIIAILGLFLLWFSCYFVFYKCGFQFSNFDYFTYLQYASASQNVAGGVGEVSKSLNLAILSTLSISHKLST